MRHKSSIKLISDEHKIHWQQNKRQLHTYRRYGVFYAGYMQHLAFSKWHDTVYHSCHISYYKRYISILLCPNRHYHFGISDDIFYTTAIHRTLCWQASAPLRIISRHVLYINRLANARFCARLYTDTLSGECSGIWLISIPSHSIESGSVGVRRQEKSGTVNLSGRW